MSAARKYLLACLGVMWFALAICCRVQAAESDALAEISRRLAAVNTAQSLQAEYVQTKRIAVLKNPVRTTGSVVFLRDRGMLWRIDKPYRGAYLLGRDVVVEYAADGSARRRPLRDVPAMAYVGEVLKAIVRGDPQKLSEHFELRGASSGAAWTLRLTPKAELARFLTGISLRGGRFVEEVDVEEAGGDSTHIDFSNTRLDAALADADRAMLHE